MKNICDTINNYVEDKRDLQFNKVTALIQTKKEPLKTQGSKKTHKRLLENIEVSYIDFEKKNDKNNKSKY